MAARQGIVEQFQDLVERESRLPEINADACVYSAYDRAECRACVEACPSQAWILDADSLRLDTRACDGCGLCVPACPGGALSVPFPYIVRQSGGQLMALFACARSGIGENHARLGCINALGLRQLLLLYNSGIAYLLVARGDCSNCRYRRSTAIDQRLRRLNELLQERDQPAMKILQRSTGLWRKIYATDEIIPRGTKLSRRQFLRGENNALRRNLLVMDPLNLAESRTVPPGQLLPQATQDGVRWPSAPTLNTGRCNGCDACVNLCPTEALQLTEDEANSRLEYRLDPARCNGCGICVSVCESRAISVQSFTRAPVRRITLDRQTCAACGNRFHLPAQSGERPNRPLCRVCTDNNQRRNLFQVLD